MSHDDLSPEEIEVRLAKLSKTERSIVYRLVHNLSVEQIASDFNREQRTIRNLLTPIYKKLELSHLNTGEKIDFLKSIYTNFLMQFATEDLFLEWKGIDQRPPQKTNQPVVNETVSGDTSARTPREYQPHPPARSIFNRFTERLPFPAAPRIRMPNRWVFIGAFFFVILIVIILINNNGRRTSFPQTAPTLTKISFSPIIRSTTTPTKLKVATKTRTQTKTPAPTSTRTPTSTLTPVPTPFPLPFTDQFDSSISPLWTTSGSYYISNGNLTSDGSVSLFVGNSRWENYKVEFRYTTGSEWSDNNPNQLIVGVRASDSRTMIALKWESYNFDLYTVRGGLWDPVPGTHYSTLSLRKSRDGYKSMVWLSQEGLTGRQKYPLRYNGCRQTNQNRGGQDGVYHAQTMARDQ